MIKFFKRIRQQLLQENLSDRQAGSIQKYLLYALGEILLVVIGILLALQINNWNEYRKERIMEKNYLLAIKTDLEKDTAFLHQLYPQGYPVSTSSFLIIQKCLEVILKYTTVEF